MAFPGTAPNLPRFASLMRGLWEASNSLPRFGLGGKSVCGLVAVPTWMKPAVSPDVGGVARGYPENRHPADPDMSGSRVLAAWPSDLGASGDRGDKG
jgi:hypothetical protein